MTPTERTEKLVERVAPIVARALAKRAGLADHRPADAWLNEATVATRSTLDASGIGEMVAENRELRNIIASLGYCAPEASLEFMRLIPGEVALSRARATQSGEG